MNKLITKARSGVTLVELLVVILIVTILSVSLLPLLQPFVTEAQYAAEPVPVIGNLRTKLGVYQYDKGSLPFTTNANLVQTWKIVSGSVDQYEPASYDGSSEIMVAESLRTQWDANNGAHYAKLIDIDFQDLKGKRSNPTHFHYYVMNESANPSYVIGCFGDGNGLKAGTGYAVCELNYPKRKYIGTWKRYKPATTNSVVHAIQFLNSNPDTTEFCYVPDSDQFKSDYGTDSTDLTKEPSEITRMKNNGWEF